MQQYFIIATSKDGGNLDAIIQADEINQVIPLWAQHFKQTSAENVCRIYLIPPVGPQIRVLAWEDLPYAEVNTKH